MLALRLNNEANKKPSRARLAPTLAAAFVGWGAFEEVARRPTVLKAGTRPLLDTLVAITMRKTRSNTMSAHPSAAIKAESLLRWILPQRLGHAVARVGFLNPFSRRVIISDRDDFQG